jgi:hypothetical protein
MAPFSEALKKTPACQLASVHWDLEDWTPEQIQALVRGIAEVLAPASTIIEAVFVVAPNASVDVFGVHPRAPGFVSCIASVPSGLSAYNLTARYASGCPCGTAYDVREHDPHRQMN